MSDQTGITPEEMTMEELEASIKGEELPPRASAEEAPNEQSTEGQPEEVEEETPPLAAEQAQEEVAEAPNSALPEKYRGKSVDELAKILLDQESYIGKLGNERSATKREMDELRDRIKEVELKPQSRDPQGDLRQGLEEDPAEALINYVDSKVSSIEARETQKQQRAQEMEFESYYNDKMSSDPDFLRRRDSLDVVADSIKEYFKPNMLKSKGFIEIVDLVSKASDMDHYINERLAAQRQTKETALNEKRQAKTESSTTQGASAMPSNPGQMSNEELEQALREALSNK